MPTITVHVTQGDIDAGCFLDSTGCPVALALWRHTRLQWDVSACGAVVTEPVGGDGRQVMVRLPDSVRRFVSEFDSGRDVLPFSFRIDVPEFADPEPSPRTLALKKLAEEVSVGAISHDGEEPCTRTYP